MIVDFLSFNQFGDTASNKDKLIMFAAPAKAITAWAGVPRKGWNIRMLYQRKLSEQRIREITNFWNEAAKSDPTNGGYILGPTAIVIGIQNDACLTGHSKIDITPKPLNKIHVDAKSSNLDDVIIFLSELAERTFPSVIKRLGTHIKDDLSTWATYNDSINANFNNDYVHEFAVQLFQIKLDTHRFIADNGLTESDIRELVEALDAINRPAIVIDGQHRLIGASQADANVFLPVVAIPNADWIEQIYQFVVINEKSERVPPSLLTEPDVHFSGCVYKPVKV